MEIRLKSILNQIPWWLACRAGILGIAWWLSPFWVFFFAANYFYWSPFFETEGVLCAFFLTLVLAGASAPIGRSRGRGGTLFLILGGKEFVFVHRTRLSGVLSVFLLYAWILAGNFY